MKIKEVELKNFRLYYGLNKIDLETNDKNIVLISGKNGFGKTTFLMALVWCLYGKQMQEVDESFYKEINDQGGYYKYIGNSLNRLAKTQGETSFSISTTFIDIKIPEISCKEIKIIRKFNILDSDSVEILIDGYPNELTQEIGTEIFIRDFILPKDIAKFFLFDAEKIVSLAEVNTIEQRKKLSIAYSEVLGIKKYEDLKKNLEDMQIRLRQDSASKKEKEELNYLISKVEVTKNEIEEFEERKKEIDDKKNSNKYDSNKIQEKLIREGNLITAEELDELKAEAYELEQYLEQLQNDLKSSYDIIPFAITGDLLNDLLKQIESENNIKSIRYNYEKINEVIENILTDLGEERKHFTGVIENRVDEFYKATIKKLIKKHFYSGIQEPQGEINIYHDFSDSELNEFKTLVNNIKLSFKETFKRTNGNFIQTVNELRNIRIKIKNAEENKEDPIIAELRRQKDQLEKEIIIFDNEIIQSEVRIVELKKDIVNFEKKIYELSKKIEVSAKNKEKDQIATSLISKLKDFIIRFKEEKKKSLEEQILKSLKTLMHKKDFISKVVVDITVEFIDIQLYNNRGEEVKKETLSKGEQQMYATSLLMGLVEESEIEFPVFIDSPMQKFDETHSVNIVQFFYPNISNQVVIFPLLKKELSTEEYKILLPNISKSYIIHNKENDKSSFIEIEPNNLFEKYEGLYQDAN